MSDLAELTLRIKSELVLTATQRLNQLTNAAKSVENQANRLNSTWSKQSALQDRVTSGYSRMLILIGKVTAGIGLLGAAFSAVKLAAELEQTQIAFETMLGSVDKANKMMAELRKFADVTPFNFTDLAKQAQFLLAMGTSAEKVMPMLRSLANAASALGGGAAYIERFSLALGQMQAKGKVETQELRQLAEAGIPAFQILAEALGKTVGETMKLVENAAIRSDFAVQAFLAGMDKHFKNALERQSKTIIGLFSTIRDYVQKAGIQIGQSLIEAFDLQKKMQTAIIWIRNFGLVLSDAIRILKGLPPEFDGTETAARQLASALTVTWTVLKVLVAIQVASFLKDILVGLVAIAGQLATMLPLIVAVTAALAAIEFGRYLRDNSLAFNIFSVNLLKGTKDLWSGIKLAWNLGSEYIKKIWNDAWAAILTVISGALDKIATALQKVEGLGSKLGLNLGNTSTVLKATAGAMESYANTLTSSTFADITSKGVATFSKEIAESSSIAKDSIEILKKEMSNIKDVNFADYVKKDVTNAITSMMDAVRTATSGFVAFNTEVLKIETIADKLDKLRDKMGMFGKIIPGPTNKISFSDTAMPDRKNAYLDPSGMSAKQKDALKDVQQFQQDLELEKSLIGKTNDERERAIELGKFQRKLQEAYIGDLDLTAAMNKAAFGDTSDLVKYGEGLAKIGQAVDKYRKALDEVQRLRNIQKIAEGIGSAFADAFTEITFNVKSATEAIRSFSMEVTKLIFKQLVADPLAQSVTKGIAGFLGGIIPGLGPKSANGNVFGPGGLMAFANGGVVNGPTYFKFANGVGLMGEAGPEAIMPLKRGRDGKLGVESNGSNKTTVVNFNVTTPNADSFRRNRQQLLSEARRALG